MGPDRVERPPDEYDVVDAESGDVVAVAPASRKEGLKGRSEDGRLAASGFGTTPKPRPSCSRSVPTGLRDMGGGLLTAEWTGLWARSPLSDHQVGSTAKVSAKCSARIG